MEKCKDKDLLESLLKEMAGEFPQLSRIFVDERDQYMAYVLQTLMQTNTLAKIAAWRNVRSKCKLFMFSFAPFPCMRRYFLPFLVA